MIEATETLCAVGHSTVASTDEEPGMPPGEYLSALIYSGGWYFAVSYRVSVLSPDALDTTRLARFTYAADRRGARRARAEWDRITSQQIPLAVLV